MQPAGIAVLVCAVQLVACGGEAAQVREDARFAADRAQLDYSEPQFSADSHVTSTLELSAELISLGGEGGVSIGPDGTIYVSNFNTSVWIVSPAGEVALLTDQLTTASGNALLPGGDLLQADFRGNRVVRIAPSGALTDFSTEGLDGPVGVAVTDDGAVLVANCLGGYIARIPSGGGAAALVAADERFGCPNGIAVDGAGGVLVADLESPILFHVSPDGEVSEYANLGGPGNGHLTWLGDALYVTQLRAHQIVRLAADGTQSVVAGTGRRGFSNGPEGASTLSHPNGIAASPIDGRIYFNTHIGVMQGGHRGAMILRRLDPPDR